MGAGQIGGIATILDLDFNNAAGFMGSPANNLHGQYIVYYLSHAMLFCTGVLIEPHVVLTPAVCVYGERYKFDVYGGTHKFLEGTGIRRTVENMCIHRAYNHTERQCSSDNIALLVLKNQFGFRHREPESDYIVNRVRYGKSYDALAQANDDKNNEIKCYYFGWGSRRNGFLLPLLIDMRRIEVKLLESEKCAIFWNTDNKFLCLKHHACVNEKYGALCPDDIGSVIECGGYIQGMMVSQLIDRPCGVGFLNLALYTKFIECAVDDSREATEDIYISVVTPDVSTVTVPESTTPCDGYCGPNVTLSKPTRPDMKDIIDKIFAPEPPAERKRKHRQRV